MGKRVMIGLGIVALMVLSAGSGYLFGLSRGEARASQARQQFTRERLGGQGAQFPELGQAPRSGQQVGLRAGGGVVGTIESVEGDTLLVSTQEGTIRVKTTDTTLIEKFTSVGVEGLEAGEQVMVAGSTNDDGSVTARSIQSLRTFQAPQTNQP